MRWRRRWKITPRSRISGLLRHMHNTTFARRHRARAITRVTVAICPAAARASSSPGLIAGNLRLAWIARIWTLVRNGP
jgi:hypothetical protein